MTVPTATDVTAGLDAHVVVNRRPRFGLDVELAIAPGTTAALLGPNGAGKSTFVAAVAGLEPLDEGHVTLAGRTLDDPGRGVFVPPEHRHVGVVFQQYLLFDHLTVRDNIAFGPASTGATRRRSHEIADRWLEMFELTALAHEKPVDLSGGQTQQVALARALAADPTALLLDEPLAALDVTTRTRLRRTLAGHLETFAGPRLLITHDPADAFLMADLIHVVEGGRITQTGTADDIRLHPATPYVADLAGTNLLAGRNEGGVVVLDGHDHALQAADTHTTGPVLVTIHPNALVLHVEAPHGSARNQWQTTVTTVEPLGDTTRVGLGDPVPLTADVTPQATTALGLAPGRTVWVSIKATEITLTPA